jgi:hypothetical protein
MNELRRMMGTASSMCGRQTTFVQCSVEGKKLKKRNIGVDWRIILK